MLGGGAEQCLSAMGVSKGMKQFTGAAVAAGLLGAPPITEMRILSMAAK
jgi:hypothetical protein